MNKRTLFYLMPLAVFVLIGALLAIGLTLDPRKLPSPLVGRDAPQFALPELKEPERIVGTEQLRGDVVLFNVWASWCVSCRAEHPVLQAMADRHGVTVYGLNYKDKRADALQYLSRLGDPYGWNAFDREGRVGIDWGVYGTPETFIIDRQGRIRYKHVGPISWQQAEKEILPLIRQLRSEG